MPAPRRTILLASCLTALAGCATASAPEGFARGVSLGLFGDEPRVDYRQQLREIRALGASHVSLVLTGFVRDVHGSEVYGWPGFTPTPEQVGELAREARADGLDVTIFPILRLERRTAAQWRGVLTPRDDAAFFDSYERFLIPYALAAAQARAGAIIVGSELGATERHEARWRRLIAHLREVFAGRLLYSANWDHYERVPFWDALDAVGISAYFELQPKERAEAPPDPPPPLPSRGAPAIRDTPPRAASVDEMARAWERVKARLDRFRRRVGRPIVFTEIGYPSQHASTARPWDEARAAPLDLEEQRRAFLAFARAFTQPGPVEGAYVWIWFEPGGRQDLSYTPRGKPAEFVLRNFFRPASWLPPPR